MKKHTVRRLMATVVASAVMLSGFSTAWAATSPAPPTASAPLAEGIAVAADGTVANDPAYDGPQVQKVRVLKERNFLEIYWDRYVNEKEAVDIDNYLLKNGDTVLRLEAKPENGATNTLYFDKNNQEVHATEAKSMDFLPENVHMASIYFSGSIDETQPITLEIKGDTITDNDGKTAKSTLYTDVPHLSFYTQFVTTDTGIVVKADDTVQPESLQAAKSQIDIMLSKEGTGMAETLAKNNASLAVYSTKENVYFIPEHRGGFSKDMYEVEGYGGSMWNGCVSSIAERNIVRTLNSDSVNNTKYRNENILIHEFGHCVKLVGLEQQDNAGEAGSLAQEFKALYQSRMAAHMWPNTYASNNEDEFFATMCAIWFSVMQESRGENLFDGVRSPINTREELKVYDPETYAFFAKIFPETYLESPWTPDSIPNDRSVDFYYADPPIDPTDLGLSANLSVSYCSGWEDAAGVNDGVIGSNSAGNGVKHWGTWGNESASEWAQYTWKEPVSIDTASIYFYEDNGGIQVPASYKFEYLDKNGNWTEVPHAAGYGVAEDAFNDTTFDKITTTSLRVTLQKQAANSNGIGIIEWRAYDSEGVKPEIPQTPTVPSASLTGDSNTIKLGQSATVTVASNVEPIFYTDQDSWLQITVVTPWTAETGKSTIEIKCVDAPKQQAALASVFAKTEFGADSGKFATIRMFGFEMQPIPAYKDNLNDFIAKAQGLVNDGTVDGMVESAKKVYLATLDKAKEVAANENATYAEVMDVQTKLMVCITTVNMKAGDKEALGSLIGSCTYFTDEMLATNYVEAGQAEYKTALADANKVYADGDAFQENVDKARDDLFNAVSALRMKANKSALQALLNQVNGIDLSLYSEESVALLHTAMENVNSVLANEALSVDDQATVDEAVKTLQAAVDGLQLKQTAETPETPETPADPTDPNKSTDPSDNSTGSESSKAGTTSKTSAKTGDAVPMAGAAILVLAAGAMIFIKRHRK